MAEERVGGVSRYEHQFMNWVYEIMNNGYYQMNERTKVATKRVSHAIIAVDCNEECPVLKSKKTLWKSSIHELFWIFRDGSNDIHDLKPHIWDDWADENGIVQKTYGYQIREYDQVNRVLNDLARDPSTRRAVIDLWNNADLPEMSITPCVYTSVWDVVDGKLNVLVTSRSCDFLVGGVFNIFQYTMLCKLFAKHLGLTPGIMTFVAADCNIYADQFDGCRRMMRNYQVILGVGRYKEFIENKKKENPNGFFSVTSENFVKWVYAQYISVSNMDEKDMDEEQKIKKGTFGTMKETIEECLKEDPEIDFVKIYECEPEIELTFGEEDPEKKWTFFDSKIEDVHVRNYSSMPRINFPVAV